MTRRARLGALLAALDGPVPRGPVDLCAALSVAPEVLARDLTDLLAAGYPIEGSDAEGFRLVRTGRLGPVEVDLDALDRLRARLVAEAGDIGLIQLAALLGAVLSPDVGGIDLDTLAAEAGTPAGWRQGARLLPALRHAIRTRRPVALAYRDRSGDPTHRLVDPLGLERWSEGWALIAWCRLREDFRSFRLDRMDRATVVATDPRPLSPGREWADFLALHRYRD